MFITTINFHRALEWFCQSPYEYLLLYASGSSIFDYEMVEEFMKYKSLIDRQTGDVMCFLHFIEKSEIQPSNSSTLLQANHNRAVEDFMLYHISSEIIRNMTRRNLYNGCGMEATFETTDELCDFFGISRYMLPAFILVHKPSKAISAKDIRDSFTVYSIKRKEDFSSLLMPIKIINDMLMDLKKVNQELYSVEKEPCYDLLLSQIKGIEVGIRALMNETKDGLVSEVQLRLSDINALIKDEYGISGAGIQMENPEKVKKCLYGLGLLEDFMKKHSDKYYLYKSSFYKAKKWTPRKDDCVLMLQNDLERKKSLLKLAKNRDTRLEALKEEKYKISEFYKHKIEESLLVEDASELVDAVLNNNSSLPGHLIASVREHMNKESLVNSMLSEIKAKVCKQEFDVFISCKSEDYRKGEEVYKFLLTNGYNPFIASKSLRQIAEDKYSPVISEVIDTCRHMIVFASDIRYVNTPYVRSEWEMFCNEVKAGRKNGKLLTIIDNPKLGPLLPIDLRCREVLSIADYKIDICKYLSISVPGDASSD